MTVGFCFDEIHLRTAEKVERHGAYFVDTLKFERHISVYFCRSIQVGIHPLGVTGECTSAQTIVCYTTRVISIFERIEKKSPADITFR